MGGSRIQGAPKPVVRGLVSVSAAVVVLVGSGCSYSSDVDLASNPYIYQSPNYQAPRSTEAPVYVQRMRYDEQPPDFSDRDSVKTRESDSVWQRRLPVMVEEILLNEIDHSGIYDGISSGSGGVPRANDYVIEPTLLALYRYREAKINGAKVGKRRSGAYAAMRLKVSGPIDASGKREVLMDKVFQDLVLTKFELKRPEKGIVLAGRALQNVMSTAMVDLYESNIRAVPGAPKK